jgi:hypothetical protein
MANPKIEFCGEELTVNLHTYANNRSPALKIIDKDGLPFMTATTNIRNVVLDPNQCLIKDFSENKGILKVLVDSKIVKDTGKTVTAGFCEANLVEIIFDFN